MPPVGRVGERLQREQGAGPPRASALVGAVAAQSTSTSRSPSARPRRRPARASAGATDARSARTGALARRNGESGDRGQVLAMTSTGGAEAERVRAGRWQARASSMRAPRGRCGRSRSGSRARSASARRRRSPSTMRTMSGSVAAGRHEVDRPVPCPRPSRNRSPGPACPCGSGASVRRTALAGASSQRPWSGVAEQRRKAGARVEAGEAHQSIDPSG